MAQHEWEEDMMQETGGEFLLIHVSPVALPFPS